jgi:hypothetical protein
MSWEPALAEARQMVFTRVGFMRGTARIYFRLEGDQSPKHVIELSEVASIFDGLQRGAEVRIYDSPEHGSFGWWLPPNEPHHSIRVSCVGDASGFFLALAKRVEYRFAGSGEALNWPG